VSSVGGSNAGSDTPKERESERHALRCIDKYRPTDNDQAMKRIVLIVPAVAIVFVLTPSAGSVTAPALARVVHCGEVLTVDTRVDNDLACPTPVALEIGADGVDLDLQGHTIEAVTFFDENGGIHEDGEGLRTDGYHDVSVENGTLIGNSSLGFGVRAFGAERLSLRRLSIMGYASLYVSGDGARIVDVTARGFGTNISSSGATIDGLTAYTELDVFGQAVEVTNGDFRSFSGFHVDDSSLHHNILTEGFFSGNGNSILRNQGGEWVLVGGGGNTVRGNRIPLGLSLSSGFSGNLIRNNLLSSGDAWYLPPDGIFVAAGAANNVLVSNSASGSADDGIDVEEPSTTLAGNRAFDNGDFGIEAVAGAIDGGGNRAWDNGNPLQCLNVDCR
jgi:parallel beta-helix repeat protein